MVPFFLLIFLAAINMSAALDFNDWHPPVSGDVRSPCPGLNALANHNIIPHSGKNLTPEILVPAITAAYNISPGLATFLAKGGVKTSPNPSSGSFDLDNLGRHNLIEHDASLSRSDFGVTGDDDSFRPEIFDTVLRYFEPKGNVTIPAAAAARYHRILTEKKRDPSFDLSVKHKFLSYGETALYLLTMVDPETGATPTEFVRILFEEERLPYKEGWRPPKQQLHPFTFLSKMAKLLWATTRGESSSPHGDDSDSASCMRKEGDDPIENDGLGGKGLTKQVPLA